MALLVYKKLVILINKKQTFAFINTEGRLGGINHLGIEHYNRLIDALIRNGNNYPIFNIYIIDKLNIIYFLFENKLFSKILC